MSATAGSRLISVPNAVVVSRRSASISSANGITGSRTASPIPASTMPGARRHGGVRARDEHGDDARDRHRDREALDPGDLVADLLREQDVRRPARRGGEREGDPAGVRRAVPRLGEQQHADGGDRRPDLRRPAAARDRDAERPEELERARRPERQAGDGRHEAQRQGRRSRRRARPTRPARAGRRRWAAAGRARAAGRPPTRGAGPPRPRGRRRRTGRPTPRCRSGRTPSPPAPCRRRHAARRAGGGGARRIMRPVNRTRTVRSTST